ncbi:MAG: peroxiredoxin family protein [Actinobacteria bacterium]|nr:peroxiredoxin family protein [Actinomycetota bacterium]
MTSTRSPSRPRRGSASVKRRVGLTRTWVTAAVVGIVAVAGLAVVYVTSGGSRAGGTAEAGEYAFAVGDPGPGEQAPAFELPSTTGGTVALDDYRGETVLLYFQEGLMCQPCWDQLTDIEARWADFQAAGVDRIVSVTTDPLDALEQKVELEGISSPVLSDRDLAVSRQYDTNSYGMMGGSHNGHSFILVGPDGQIEWRADYGGEPDYTMYLPVENLLADLRAGQDS